MNYSNIHNIPLALQVWLVDDQYDYVKEEKYISATTLMKPTRQIILGSQGEASTVTDLSDLIACRMGSALHESIELAWTQRGKDCLATLGYPKGLIKQLQVNPEKVEPGMIPVWLEQRTTKQLNGWTIGGKFDMVLNGELQDFKSTSVWTYIKDTKADDYILQGSIYRWLNPDKITSDTIQINFIFTDWSKVEAERKRDYPQSRITTRKYQLLSVAETERFILNKLKELDESLELDEKELPPCPEQDLWFPQPTYKYFANAEKTSGRATKVFKSLDEATNYQFMEKGGKGIVLTVLGQPRRCQYCSAFNICSQKDKYYK